MSWLDTLEDMDAAKVKALLAALARGEVGKAGVAIATIEEFGVHSAGSPALVGNTSLSLTLEKTIGEFGGEECLPAQLHPLWIII